jgi:hypothetical protein
MSPSKSASSIAARRWRLPIRLSATVLGLLLAGSAGADAMRCGIKVVREGDTQMAVRDLCGEPSDVQVRSILRRPSIWRNGRRFYLGDAVVEVPVEFWTYNFGPYKLMRRVKFVDGLLDEIETLGYGYNPPANDS